MVRLERSVAEGMAVVPAAVVNAPEDDLGTRFASVLDKLGTREVGARALLDTLRLETLDWGFDHGVEIQAIECDDTPAVAAASLDKA